MESLTKENFWNEMYEKYPEATQHFCKWIDEYKKRVEWNMLFNSQSDYQDVNGKTAPAPKYHDLPIAMQVGIFQQYLWESGHFFYSVGNQPYAGGSVWPISLNWSVQREAIERFFGENKSANMEGTTYPIRSQIPINNAFKIEVWHDAKMQNTRFKICQRKDKTRPDSDSPLTGHWFVRAEFEFAFDFLTYLKTWDPNLF